MKQLSNQYSGKWDENNDDDDDEEDSDDDQDDEEECDDDESPPLICPPAAHPGYQTATLTLSTIMIRITTMTTLRIDLR